MTWSELRLSLKLITICNSFPVFETLVFDIYALLKSFGRYVTKGYVIIIISDAFETLVHHLLPFSSPKYFSPIHHRLLLLVPDHPQSTLPFLSIVLTPSV